VGANSTIDRARFGKTLIRKGTKIDNLVQVGHNVKIGQHCLIIAQAGIAGSSQLGNYVTLAAKVGVSGHLTLDDGVILGACAAATKSLKKNAYLGVPAIPLKESKKQIANVSRLPILKNRVTALEEKLVELEAKLAQSEME